MGERERNSRERALDMLVCCLVSFHFLYLEGRDSNVFNPSYETFSVCFQPSFSSFEAKTEPAAAFAVMAWLRKKNESEGCCSSSGSRVVFFYRAMKRPLRVAAAPPESGTAVRVEEGISS